MSDQQHYVTIQPVNGGGSLWRAFVGGSQLFDIQLDVSSMLNGSRYYILNADGVVTGDGTFNLGRWSEKARDEVLEAIVRSKLADAVVDVQHPSLQRTAS